MVDWIIENPNFHWYPIPFLSEAVEASRCYFFENQECMSKFYDLRIPKLLFNKILLTYFNLLEGKAVIKLKKWAYIVYEWPLILNVLYLQACRLSLALGQMSGATIYLMAKHPLMNGKSARMKGIVQHFFNTPRFSVMVWFWLEFCLFILKITNLLMRKLEDQGIILKLLKGFWSELLSRLRWPQNSCEIIQRVWSEFWWPVFV